MPRSGRQDLCTVTNGTAITPMVANVLTVRETKSSTYTVRGSPRIFSAEHLQRVPLSRFLLRKRRLSEEVEIHVRERFLQRGR